MFDQLLEKLLESQKQALGTPGQVADEHTLAWVVEGVKGEIRPVKDAVTGEPITVEVYHGTPDGRFLPEFDPDKKGYFKNAPDDVPWNEEFIQLHGGIRQGFKRESITGNIGVSFSDDYSVAKSYADKPAFDNQNAVPMVVKRTVTLKNPKVLDMKGAEWKLTVGKDIEAAIAEGHDGIVIKNVKDNYHPSTTRKPTNNIIAFDTESFNSPNTERVGESQKHGDHGKCSTNYLKNF